MSLDGGGGAPGTPSLGTPSLSSLHERTPLVGTEAKVHGRDLHLLLLRLHRGDIIGKTGNAVSLVSGVALVVLCVTGAVLYGKMLLQRIQRGHRTIFWK